MSGVTAEDIHAFWFGPIDSWAEVAARNKARWFRDGKSLDEPIRARFAPAVVQARDGALDHWSDTPRKAMALILLLDQFPRHIHRGTAQAFASDERALRICLACIARGIDDRLSPVEQSFFYLPLQHAEDVAAQRTSVERLELRAAGAPAELEAFMAENLEYARKHRDIVDRFGRFPHRNEALGRSSTAEERAYLDGGGQRFGQ